ncbi:hypothetical protein AB0K40_17935 [Nonomuraea bangladeshensis]|uniref:Uncharacterized protein n=1 Tax=Nonomuraea bangladeshensis TaxID=404385 RepID=A0ABV3H4E4_9ACTN
MSRLLVLARHVRAWRRARRDYRALCAEGRAPHVQVNIRIHPDDDEWTGLNGITGIATTVPLTPAGKRYVRGVLADIEATCVHAVLAANEAARRVESAPPAPQPPAGHDSPEHPPHAATAPPTPQPEINAAHRNEEAQ